MNITEYVKRLGIEPKSSTASPLDIEAGKAGYNQYLADVEAATTTKQEAKDNESFLEKIGRYLGNGGAQDTSLGLNQGFNQAVEAYKNMPADNKPKDDWTDEERWAFGEKYATNTEDAYAFAKDLNSRKAKEQKQKQEEAFAKWSGKNIGTGILGSAASLGINAVMGSAGYLDALAQRAAGREVEQNVILPHEISGAMQGGIANKLNEKGGTINEKVPIFGGKGWGDVYGLGMSIGQSALAGATGGSAGTLIQFFGMSASQGVSDALARGATGDQAIAFGTIAGAAEAITEMISIDKILGIASAEGVQNLFKNILKQAGEEAREEFTTAMITNVADNWIMGGKSQFYQTVNQLVASGMSVEEAKKKAWLQTIEDIAFDTLSGAASGGISGAGATAINRINQQFLETEKNEAAKKALAPEQSKLIEEGKKYDTTKKRAEALEKKLADGKELNGYDLRVLANQVNEASRTADVDTTRKAIVERMKTEGVSESQAKTLGEIALNKAIGNDVSKVQELMLKRNAAAMKVYNQISAEVMESGMGESEWAEKTPIQRLRAEKKASEMISDVRTQPVSGAKLEQVKGQYTEVDGKITFKKSENSRIHIDGITSSLTADDIAELSAIEKIANELGIDIHVYETTVDEKGQRTYTDKTGKKLSDSGFYDPNNNSIHIDLRAGQNGEGTMLYTASHEVVHFIKENASEHYAALEELVTKELVKGGFSMEKAIEVQRKKAIENGQTLTDEQFREEVVAEACQSFLASKSAVAEIKALKTKNKGLWTALKKFFTSLFTKLNKVYKTVDPDSIEGKYISDMRGAVKNIRDAFMEGAVAAGEKYNAERKALGEGATVKLNSNGEFVQAESKDGKTIMSNARTYKNGGRATLKATLEAEGYSEADVEAALKIMDGHMELVKEFGEKYTAQDVANNAVLTTDVKTGEAVLSAIISNGDYPVNIDLLTICKKREAYQQVINRLCESGMINKATVDSLAIAEINKILGKYGFETACLGCYVESRRIRIQEWAQTIVKEWNGIVDKLEGKGKGKALNASSEAFVADLSNEEVSKLSAELEEAYERDGLKYGRATVVKKMEQLQREVPSLRRYLSVADLITPTGRANLKSWSSEVNSLVNCRYGSNTPKIIQKFNPYNSELAKYGIVPKGYKDLRDYLYAIGGARMQSFSDFIVENWFDYAQIVADLSARKLPMHTYTKEAILVKLFGMTGIKINMSLIPDVDSSLGKEYAGLTKNSKGEYELIFADKDRYKATSGKSYMQSFNFADAIALQNDPNYSANVGTIAIGISDKQIEMMLDDSRIRMVIPYHSSGMNPIFAHLVGIKNYNDYTNYQNTTVKRLVDADGNVKNVRLKKEQIANLTKGFQFNEALQRLGDARKAADEYKAWCRDSSKHTITIDGKTYYAELTPKFEQFSAHENYYKLLADYNPYDCITEESKPQGDVTQTYPDNFSEMLGDELRARDIYAKKQDAKWDDAMAEINSYLETHTRADTVKYADEHGIKISEKDRKLAKKEVRHQVRNIVGASGKNYGKGVYLDSTLLTGLTDTERVQMVKEYIKELGGSVFTAYDDNNKPVDIHIVEPNQRFRNKSGRKVSVNRDMLNYLNNPIKQEAIALIDELISASNYQGVEPATHPHDWVDNNGKNDWDIWTTYIQDKENTVWEAKLRIANATNGEKILYDVFPIEMVEQSRTMDTSTTKDRIAQSTANVNTSDENSSKKREIRSKARTTDNLGNELTDAQAEYFKDSKVRDSKGNLMVLYHGTTADFNVFKKGDVGYHFGTKSAARGRVGYGKNVTIKEVYLNITNPIAFDEDLGSWDADYRLTEELYNRGIITQEEAESVLLTDSKQYRRTTEQANKKLASVLLGKGYDGIEYTNTHETQKPTTSYIVFDSNQAKLITNANPTSDKDIRHKSRSYTAGQVAAPYVSPTATSIVTDIDSGYDYTKADKLRSGAIATQIAFTNAQAGIESIAKKYGVKNIESLVQAARVASRQADEMISGSQYRIGADTKVRLGDGLQKIFSPIEEKGEEVKQAFFDYLFHYHNADRMSLEQRSIEWNNAKKQEHQAKMQRFTELEKEQIALFKEKAALTRKKSDSARRQEINQRLTKIKREISTVTKLIKKLQKEIDSFVPLKNKAVIGLNRAEIMAKKAELSKQIDELIAQKKALGRSKQNAAEASKISLKISELIAERDSLTAEVTAEKSKETIAEYEKNYDYFREVAEKIWQYNRNLNQYRVDTGLINQEQFDYLEKLYPHYVPSYRADVSTGIAAVKGRNNLAISQSIKTATGSTKDLLNPIVIMARQTMETIRAGRINQIAEALYNGAGQDKTYLAEISRKKVNNFEVADIDPTELRPKANQVTFFKNGERIVLKVSSEIFAGFDAFAPMFDIKNPLVRGVSKATELFKKLVTSANPVFLIRNAVRDLQDAGINTKYSAKAFMLNYAEAIKQIKENGELWELYKAMGGSNASYFDFDKGFLAEQTKRGFSKKIKDEDAGKAKKAWQTAQGFAQTIENANAFVETLPRLAEFISSIQAGNTAEQAMLDAADVTTNFARSGKITKALNSTVIPFLNPAIQGASKAVRNVTSIRSLREAAILAAKATILGIAPFLLNALLYRDDEDYEDLRESDKENNYLIKIGDVFWKIPRGRVASVLAGATNRSVKEFLTDEEVDWGDYLKNVSTQMNPLENMARTIFSPFLDVANNVTWYGSAIEGREFENKAPKDRFDEGTSSIAIAMGKVLNYSPKKIHYLIDQYSGVIGDFILPATTKKAEKGFLSGNFTIDPVTANKLSDDFYDIYYDAQYAKSADPNDKVAEYQVKHLNRVKSSISELFKAKDEIQNSNMSDREKRAETEAIQILINEAYKTALEDYDLITNAIKATSKVDDKYRYTEVLHLVYGAQTALEQYDEKVYEKSTLLKKSGVSYEVFYNYYFATRDIESDKDKKGNPISGSKKTKVIKAIDKINTSEENKLLLIAISGYSFDGAKDKEKLIKYINNLKISAKDKATLAELCGFEYKNGKIYASK